MPDSHMYAFMGRIDRMILDLWRVRHKKVFFFSCECPLSPVLAFDFQLYGEAAAIRTRLSKPT
jgi:hypothetical protein